MILDTSALLAYFDVKESHHTAVARVIDGDGGPYIVSPFVLAEFDYFVASRMGVAAELAVLGELTYGAYEIATVSAADVIACRAIIAQYADLGIGITDASLVVLAERFAGHSICTLDRRHFDVLRQFDGKPLNISPA